MLPVLGVRLRGSAGSPPEPAVVCGCCGALVSGGGLSRGAVGPASPPASSLPGCSVDDFDLLAVPRGPAAPAGDEPIPATPVAKHYVPRVFVIRPGGEGYEFLSEAAFQRYLAAREGDPQCTVTREEVQAAGDSEAEKNTFSYIFLQKETLPQVALPALVGPKP